MKYLIITGGTISGLGKGITSASIGHIFQKLGNVVTMIKIDPYLNINAGNLAPSQHGECAVLADGAETDLDLLNYERFLNINLTAHNNITSGQIYYNVISRSMKGEYLGQTIQTVPHITDEIINKITYASHLPINNCIPDLCIIELGGTVGDVELETILFAIRQLTKIDVNKICFLHLVLLIDNNKECKTKPAQQSVLTLNSKGITPDILIVRYKEMVEDEILDKLSRLCCINKNKIIVNHDVPNVYYVPQLLYNQNIHNIISRKLNLQPSYNKIKFTSDTISHFETLNLQPAHNKIKFYSNAISYFETIHTKKIIKLGIVGKYLSAADTYNSLVKAIEHAGIFLDFNVEIYYIDSENITDLSIYDCFIIPGGFGSRGISGKTSVASYARINKIPILGICLGMQVMIVECWNNSYNEKVCSSEWLDDNIWIDAKPIINILPGREMRLGNYTTRIESTKIKSLYNSNFTIERHRHRYEFNPELLPKLIEGNVDCAGFSEDGILEIIELPDHPFYIGCQFHPEYISKIDHPHPLFVGLFRSVCK